MQTFYEGEQVSLFAQDLWCGKMSPVSSPSTNAVTSLPSLKRPRGSPSRMPLFLNLRGASGTPAGASWEMDGQSLGAYSTHSFGESPSVAVESRLSQILEDLPHPKYFLSARACAGILTRAQRRGKDLPLELKAALMKQAETA